MAITPVLNLPTSAPVALGGTTPAVLLSQGSGLLAAVAAAGKGSTVVKVMKWIPALSAWDYVVMNGQRESITPDSKVAGGVDSENFDVPIGAYHCAYVTVDPPSGSLSNLVVDISGQAAPGSIVPDIQTFDTPGAFTWNKPTGTFNSLRIQIYSAGGGGGSGARYAAAASGGGGGGGGGYSEITIPFESAAASYSGSIGAGGAGGAAVAVDSTNGNAGTDGGITVVTALIGAAAGVGGVGGTATTAAGGAGGAGTNSGGAGGNATTGAGATPASSINAPAGGGSGGGWDGLAAAAGGEGGAVLPYLADGGAAGTSPSGAGGAGASTFTDGAGTGGGGGGASAGVAAAGAGGAGGSAGAGGGGGGGTDNGQNSGAGGAGANGLAVFTAF